MSRASYARTAPPQLREPILMSVVSPDPRSTPASPAGCYLENGRYYCLYRKGSYIFPVDEQEKDRLDFVHEFFRKARRERLLKSPITNSSKTRILDLGTGTGIWAIDIADEFDKAEVVGIDLANIQSPTIPRNVRFDTEVDFLSPWTLGEDSWDLIHLRQGLGSVNNWPVLFSKVFSHLKPSCGWFELVEIDYMPRCDDGTMSEGPVLEWYGYLADATARLSRPIAYPSNFRAMLEAAGFIDIEEQVIRAPFNSWPTDEHQEVVGRFYCGSLLQSFEALSMAPLTRGFGWNADVVQKFIRSVQHNIVNKRSHAYNNVHVWTARRPG